MRKLKLLIGIAALLLGAGNVSASVTLETDLTRQFSSLTNWQNWTGASGFTATQFCPMVTVSGGIGQKQVCEKYENACTSTGDIFYQTVSGLSAGTYTIELYGGAAFTYGRGFGSQAFTGETGTGGAWGTHSSETYTAGQHIDSETGVKLYAISENIEYGGEIPIYYATNFPDGAATVKIENIVVGESGQIKIGMSKTSQSTNWHVIQLKSVIATVDGDAVITNLKNTANGLLNNATYANVTGSERTNLQAAYNATPAAETQEAYQTVITNLNTAISAFEGCDVAAYNAYATEKAKATALGMTSLDTSDPANAAEATTKTQSLMVEEYNYVTTNYSHAVSLGTWTKENATDRKSQHWDGTAASTYSEQNEGWGSSSWSCSYSQNLQLPAGNYVFKVAGRKSSNDATLTLTVKNGETVLGTVNDFPNGDTGKGIDTNGAANFGEGTYANDGNGRGWQWRYVKFTLADPATVNVAVTASATAQYNWVGFCNPTVQTDDADNVALMEALVALNNAKNKAAITKHTNAGTGIFQYNSEDNDTKWTAYETAKDNANAFTLTAESTVEQVSALTAALETAITNYSKVALNAPDANKLYRLISNKGILTYSVKEDSEGGYALNFSANEGTAQCFTFTPDDVNANTYKVSFVDADETTHYICTRIQYGEGGTGVNGIRTIEDIEKALIIKIQPLSAEEKFYMLNTESSNNKLGANTGENDGLFTVDTNSEWTITEVQFADVAISSVGLATFASDYALDFTGSNVKAYSATISGSTITFKRENKVPAGEGVLLKADEGVYQIPVATGVVAWEDDNAFVRGTGANVPSVDGNNRNYVLANAQQGVGFYLANGLGVADSKAYLQTTATTDARLSFVFSDETTGINAVQGAALAVDGEVYNLNGQRVATPKRGLYIQNGKKIIMK